MITVRDYKAEDKNFVMSTFLRGVYYGGIWFNLIPKDIFMRNYKHFVEATLASPKTIVKVACLKEDPDIILGYSVLSSDFKAIHFVFVKAAWRKQGIAKLLVPQFPEAVTHLTPIGQTLLNKFKSAVIFNPFYTQEN